MSRTRLFQDSITENLIVESDGRTGWIAFNDPARHNAISFEMWAHLPRALDAFAQDAEIRSVVLTGAGGRAFVSGANISQFDALRTAKSAVEDYERVAEQAQLAIQNFPKPLIARIDGYCIGGGANIALCCDLRIASDVSTFAIPAARLGLGYRFSAIQNLVRATGMANALEIFLTAARYDAATAREKGLIHVSCPKDELDTVLQRYLDMINANAPLTMAAGKYMIRAVSDRMADIDMDDMHARILQCFASEDYQEGKRAFAEKRPPQFKGR
jgi:enoyl-CoA hydratase